MTQQLQTNTQTEYFCPIENPSPRVLSPGQIEQYNRLGFISGLNLYSSAVISQKRQYIDGLLDQVGEDNRYAINCYQARIGGLWDICTDPHLLDFVEDLIGPDIICWASHLFCKMAFDSKEVPWHQDADFWHLSPKRTVTVWLAIDDTDAANSAMEFLPSTHTLGPLPTNEAEPGAVLGHATTDAHLLGDGFVNVLSAGQFSLHADMLVHGSRANQSARRRCGLTIRYCPSSVRMTNQQWADGVEAIVCRGSNDDYWRHHPRPDNDTVHLNKLPLNIGGN